MNGTDSGGGANAVQVNGMTKGDEEELGPKELYAAITQHITSAEQISWNRFSNFLTSNSIFVVAWATIYAASPKLPVFLTVFVQVTVCLIGITSSLVWTGLGRRSRANVNLFLRLGRRMEEEMVRGVPAWLWPCARAEKLRDEGPCRTAGSYAIMVYGPFVFTALYAVLLLVSVHLVLVAACAEQTLCF
jgi:hypothetical protein